MKNKTFTTVYRASSFPEAQLIKAQLESADIDVFLQDEESIALNWHLSLSLGGIKIQVPTEQSKDALQILSSNNDLIETE